MGQREERRGREEYAARPAHGFRFEWRCAFDDASMNALHADAFGHEPFERNWEDQVREHSLGWVCARDDDGLVGFVNVAWDGAAHAFIVDTMVSTRARRQGVGAQLVAVAGAGAHAVGCKWLHVDFEVHLRDFYFGAFGFKPTEAGLIALVPG